MGFRSFLLFALVFLSGCASFAPAGSARRPASGSCQEKAGSLPNSGMPAGSLNSRIPVKHVIVVMQENRSFDTYFGRLNQPKFYGKEVDGLNPEMSNPDKNGKAVRVFHEPKLCGPDPDHDWDDMHAKWNGGKNDGFVTSDGRHTMGFYDQRDVPYYYALANEFAIADRYFSSVLGPTYPNRYFLYAATSFGHTDNLVTENEVDWTQKTIFELLEEHQVSWRYYANWEYMWGSRGYASLFSGFRKLGAKRLGKQADFRSDLDAGRLPQVVFIDADADEADEHPVSGNAQAGQRWTAEIVKMLFESPNWKDSALFLVYDEGGGFYDHVPPPSACHPDGINPEFKGGRKFGNFDRYGFRVPFVLVSPWAKRHFVSHEVYDHTSILKFIETKFNLPALTARDANANDMLDLFDFSNPRVDIPRLPEAVVDPKRACSEDFYDEKHDDGEPNG